MMENTLTLLLRGEAPDEGACAFETLWATFGEGQAVRRKRLDDLPEDDRKAIDLISLVSLIVSIPSAALAVWDLADRIKKRQRAQKLIDEAKRLQLENRTETYFVTFEGPKPVADMTADQVLDLARSGARTPGN